MPTIAAKVATPNGGKYVRQLCRHWSHKLPVEIEGDTGVVSFVGAQATMSADAGGIDVSISGSDPGQLEALSGVVARHIDRFAFREAPLAYDWAFRES